MKIDLSYKEIWRISYPLMLFNLAQNIIGVTDMVFLGRLEDKEPVSGVAALSQTAEAASSAGETALAACGIMGIYYLVFMMIGFGLSRGAQILIARRAGEKRYLGIGEVFDNLLVAELVLAMVLFLFLQLTSSHILWYFITDPAVYDAAYEYLFYRSFGIFFSLIGFALLSLYTGIGQTRVLSFITVTILTTNILLNYSLIFGKFGFPEMGIAGAGLASSLAEVCAGIVGLSYVMVDKKLKPYGIFRFSGLNWENMKKILNIASPVVLNFLIGLGGWFVFFTFIQKLGVRALAISSVVKWIYTFFTIPSWAIGSTANALVSNVLGNEEYANLKPAVQRSCNLSLLLSAATCIFLLLIPDYLLGIITKDAEVIQAGVPLVQLLTVIVLAAAVSNVLFNAVVGTGAVRQSLVMAILAVVFYLSLAYFGINFWGIGLLAAWSLEMVYWLVLAAPALWYLSSGRWKGLKV